MEIGVEEFFILILYITIFIFDEDWLQVLEQYYT